MRRETEERETRLVALTAALQRSSARSSEHERAVASAQEELATRAAYFEAAEAFLRAKLERSCEETLVLREELGAGRARCVRCRRSSPWRSRRCARARRGWRRRRRRLRARLRAALDDQRGTTEETERELRDVTDQSAALETLRKIADGLDAETEAARKPKTDDPEGEGDVIADAADEKPEPSPAGWSRRSPPRSRRRRRSARGAGERERNPPRARRGDEHERAFEERSRRARGGRGRRRRRRRRRMSRPRRLRRAPSFFRRRATSAP